MSDGINTAIINDAENQAKLALLKTIAQTAEKTSVPRSIADLAYAYALTVGARPGELPGGPFKVDVLSK